MPTHEWAARGVPNKQSATITRVRGPLGASGPSGPRAEALVDVLGIDESLADRALAVADENALMALAETAVEWQGLALLDLATGLSVSSRAT